VALTRDYFSAGFAGSARKTSRKREKMACFAGQNTGKRDNSQALARGVVKVALHFTRTGIYFSPVQYVESTFKKSVQQKVIKLRTYLKDKLVPFVHFT
jgi:hypothetical protein